MLRKNPVWDPAIGLQPADILIIDILHCLHLGIFNQFCRLATWLLLESSVWAGDHLSMQERHEQSVLRLRNELNEWHRLRKAEHPAEDLTRITDLTLKMLGTKTAPKLKIDGGECWAFGSIYRGLSRSMLRECTPQGRSFSMLAGDWPVFTMS